MNKGLYESEMNCRNQLVGHAVDLSDLLVGDK